MPWLKQFSLSCMFHFPVRISTLPTSYPDFLHSLGIQKRDCFHPGASVLSREDINLGDAKPVSGADMVRGMLAYVWPKVNLFAIYYVFNLFIFLIAKVDCSARKR